MIPYMVGKLAPNSTHFTRRLVKYVPGREFFRAVPFPNGNKLRYSHLLDDSKVISIILGNAYNSIEKDTVVLIPLVLKHKKTAKNITFFVVRSFSDCTVVTPPVPGEGKLTRLET